MKLFAVYVYSGDLCGNREIYGPMGYFTAPSLTDAQTQFPTGAFVGYIVEEVTITNATQLFNSLEKQIEKGKFN